VAVTVSGRPGHRTRRRVTGRTIVRRPRLVVFGYDRSWRNRERDCLESPRPLGSVTRCGPRTPSCGPCFVRRRREAGPFQSHPPSVPRAVVAYPNTAPRLALFGKAPHRVATRRRAPTAGSRARFRKWYRPSVCCHRVSSEHYPATPNGRRRDD
jgi:hypothetical protein